MRTSDHIDQITVNKPFINVAHNFERTFPEHLANVLRTFLNAC